MKSSLKTRLEEPHPTCNEKKKVIHSNCGESKLKQPQHHSYTYSRQETATFSNITVSNTHTNQESKINSSSKLSEQDYLRTLEPQLRLHADSKCDLNTKSSTEKLCSYNYRADTLLSGKSKGHDENKSESKNTQSKAEKRNRANLMLSLANDLDSNEDRVELPFTKSPTIPLCTLKENNVYHSPPPMEFEGNFENDTRLPSGLPLNFALDLGDGSSEQLSKSYEISASGTFDAVGIQIKQTGLSRSHVTKELASKKHEVSASSHNFKKELVKLGVLGRGASGVVWKALHLPSMLLVAIKVIPVFEVEKRHQLVAELKSLYSNLVTLPDDIIKGESRVTCPEIVSLYNAYMNPNEGNVSIVMEYMDGGSMQDIVDSGGCKSEAILSAISYRVLKGLASLHSTYQLHRDIKPSNLLINHLGEVKISDFGIVREMENSMAKATTFVGTLTYMSPERIASEEYSYKSDVWSFGLSIMACALGRFPYHTTGSYWELLNMIRNQPPPQLPKSEFSYCFHDFLSKCLTKNQADRWSVKELLQHPFISNNSSKSNSFNFILSSNDEQNRGLMQSLNEKKLYTEIEDIVVKVIDHYQSELKVMLEEHHQSINHVQEWVNNLPIMQEVKLSRLADQLGISRSVVATKFHHAIEELLYKKNIHLSI